MGRRAWILSGLLHAAVIAAAALGLPSFFEANVEVSPAPIVVGSG